MLKGDANSYFEMFVHEMDQNPSISQVLWLPAARTVRQSKEMKQFAREQGFVDVWRERGWPDLCRPLGEDDFECD